jgi:hypothetical protein
MIWILLDYTFATDVEKTSTPAYRYNSVQDIQTQHVSWRKRRGKETYARWQLDLNL